MVSSEVKLKSSVFSEITFLTIIDEGDVHSGLQI